MAKPSAAVARRIEAEENGRIVARKAELGEAKLKELEHVLERAKAESETPPPPQMIRNFPLPDVISLNGMSGCAHIVTQPSGLTWVPVETAINNALGQKSESDRGALQQYIDASEDILPFQAHFAHVKVRVPFCCSR